MNNNLNNLINDLIMSEDWENAEKILLSELEKNSTDHWLITQLSLVYYEMFDYEKALEYSEEALSIAPKCPLVLSDYGRNLYANDLYKEAIENLRKLSKIDINEIAYGECGEGLKFARYIVNDSLVYIGLSYLELEKKAKAKEYFEMHLSKRRRGQYSNFTKNDLERYLKKC